MFVLNIHIVCLIVAFSLFVATTVWSALWRGLSENLKTRCCRIYTGASQLEALLSEITEGTPRDDLQISACKEEQREEKNEYIHHHFEK